MSTRATIGKVEADGSGRRVLLVYDGYPTWAGAKLLLNYGNEEAIESLIELGTIYTLGDSPEHTPGSFIKNGILDDGQGHVTRALSREGGYDIAEHGPVATTGGLQGVAAGWNHPYVYAWTPDGWFGCYGEGEDEGEFLPLSTFIITAYRNQYENCVRGETPPGWNSAYCLTHNRGHTIPDLSKILPLELIPPDLLWDERMAA